MTTYSEKLRDPRWQKLRLQVMERDAFICQACSDPSSPLNVHYTYYIKGNDPWDYPIGSLLTLCEECHAQETADNYSHKQAALRAMCNAGLLSRDFKLLEIGFRDSTGNSLYPNSEICSLIKFMLTNRECVDLVATAYNAALRKETA